MLTTMTTTGQEDSVMGQEGMAMAPNLDVGHLVVIVASVGAAVMVAALEVEVEEVLVEVVEMTAVSVKVEEVGSVEVAGVV